MARPSKPQVSSDDALSNGSSSSEEEQINDEEDEEELEAVARSASSDDEEAADDNSPDSDGDGDDEEQDVGNVDPEISKREKARLNEMQKLKKQKIQEMLDAQNAAIDADMNNKGKGRLKYLLQQTELFAHFAKGDQSSQKKSRGRYWWSPLFKILAATLWQFSYPSLCLWEQFISIIFWPSGVS